MVHMHSVWRRLQRGVGADPVEDAQSPRRRVVDIKWKTRREGAKPFTAEEELESAVPVIIAYQ